MNIILKLIDDLFASNFAINKFPRNLLVVIHQLFLLLLRILLDLFNLLQEITFFLTKLSLFLQYFFYSFLKVDF